MSGTTDFESYVHGQVDSVGTPATTRTAASQALRTRRIAFPKWSGALGTCTADAMASTTTAEQQGATVEVAGTIVAVYIIPNGTLTGDNTNNAAITLSKRTAAGGSKTTVVSHTTTVANGNWVAGQAVSLSLTATIADRSFAAGSTFSFEVAKNGSGVAVPAGNFVVVYTED